jgi:hypothetical protein
MCNNIVAGVQTSFGCTAKDVIQKPYDVIDRRFKETLVEAEAADAAAAETVGGSGDAGGSSTAVAGPSSSSSSSSTGSSGSEQKLMVGFADKVHDEFLACLDPLPVSCCCV